MIRSRQPQPDSTVLGSMLQCLHSTVHAWICALVTITFRGFLKQRNTITMCSRTNHSSEQWHHHTYTHFETSSLSKEMDRRYKLVIGIHFNSHTLHVHAHTHNSTSKHTMPVVRLWESGIRPCISCHFPMV